MSDQAQIRRPPPHDPNRSQNRIPSQIELVTLRNMRSNKRQLADHTKRELDQAREVHEQIQARYDRLLRELESAQSELNLSHDYLTTLETQLEVFQAEDDRLAGLLHPIRQCPADVLVLIFECSAEMDEENRFKIATAISQVCRAWRDIALRSGTLWTQVQISMLDEIESVKPFLLRTRDRVRRTPVSLSIIDIPDYSDTTKNYMECVQMQKFETLSKLHLSFLESKDVTQLIQPCFNLSPTSIHHVFIQAESKSDQSPVWDSSAILQQYDTIHTLHLDNMGEVIFDGEGSFESLKTLKLVDVSMPTLVQKLPQLVRLTVLEIRNLEFGLGSLLHDLVVPKLLDLRVKDVTGFPWGRITVPHLERLDAGEVEDDEGLERFICRHKSLRSLNYEVWIDESTFKTFAKSLIDLEILEIGGYIEGLYKKTDPDVPFPSFPKLTQLVIDTRDDHGLTQEEFEKLVRSRCLPRQAQGDDVSIISKLTIVISADDFSRAVWRKSRLMDDCQQSVGEWMGDKRGSRRVDMVWVK